MSCCDGWMGTGMMLLWILFFAVIVLGAVLVVRALLKPKDGADRDGPPEPLEGPSAVDILNERYARGQIDRDEFEERRRILDPDRPS